MRAKMVMENNFVMLSAVTIATLIMYLTLVLKVGLSRAKYKIEAPKMFGHPKFDRAFRVQLNTLEWMAIFLPLMWIAGLLVNAVYASFIGILWILSRIYYAHNYYKAAKLRTKPILFQFLFIGILFLMAIYGIIKIYL